MYFDSSTEKFYYSEVCDCEYCDAIVIDLGYH